jgi:predicted enzyme related to lactoylglutathione lyase
MASDIRGRFVWYELLTSDPKAAEDYYTKVVGWGTTLFEGAGTPYTMWMNGDTPVGGVMLLPEQAKAAGAPPHWIGYVGTPDVDATARDAADAGATILVAPQDIPSVGRFAVLQDPQGAVFSLYAPAGEHPGHEGPPMSGEFSWHELATTDHEAAFAFYAKLFGWKKTESMDMGEMGVYQMFGRGEQTLGGMFNKSAEIPGPPFWLYYTRVPDVSKAVENVTGLGGQILNGPMEVPGGDMIVQCLDPQGAAFALHASA